ncbi:MAG: Crp/Fnr family transcriptional regulator [Bacteroidetes bacterium]|jgi:CRP-like cAMP-binding protein|nr:Crp/Fnr family transcriptional regulator [Bacteroidota bacterium]
MNYFSNYSIFNSLSPQESDYLTKISVFQKKPKFSFLYLADEPSNHLLFLVKGQIKTGTHSGDGREIIKDIHHPFSIVGELGLVGEKSRNEFARALNEEVHYFTINIDNFKKLMQSNHQLCESILGMIGERLQRAESKLESLIFKDARARIIEFLKDSAIKTGRKVGFELLLKHCLTQQDIANITGTSRQTVTSVLNDLKKENLIHFNRRTILIRDVNTLK